MTPELVTAIATGLVSVITSVTGLVILIYKLKAQDKASALTAAKVDAIHAEMVAPDVK